MCYVKKIEAQTKNCFSYIKKTCKASKYAKK